MGYIFRSIVVYIILIFILDRAIASGPLDLEVVYPRPGQNLPAVDSTFIFGSAEPGSILSINGEAVEVHHGGGWLAFLPVSPGVFDFFVRAEKAGVVDTMTLRIRLPELPQYTYDSLYFRPGSFKPSFPLWVKSGDKIDVSFAATPYCNAFCVLANTGDTVAMKELPPQHYYRTKNVFQGHTGDFLRMPDSLLIRGIYQGSFVVPDIDDDYLTLIYHIYPPSFMQLTWMIKYASDFRTKPLVPHDLGALPAFKADTSRVRVRILSEKTPIVAELTDSMTVIRTGPGKGYLCIHQPAGIRAELAGKDGNWLKLKLSEYQYGWVSDTSAVILSSGTVPPHSYISLVRTVNYEDRVSVRISTSDRHPFRIIENIDERSMTLFIYGADSDTDWIRYDNGDSLIDHIVWFEPEPGIYGLKIYLTEDAIWGYEGYYMDRVLYFDIKKFPKARTDISDFRFVVDPGHALDPGAIGPTGLTEKEVNLLISMQLKRDLENEGAEVVLTRAGDIDLPLYDRPKIAVREKADIFISVHNNALPDGTNPFVNNGVSTYYYHSHSAALARAVHNSLARRLGLKDFGWYYGNLAVNRPTQYPAILVECAFMMIPEQEALLKTEKFRGEISRAIVDGIKDFLRGRPETEWDRRQEESYDWE